MAHEPLSQAKADPQKGLLGTRLVINRCPFSLPSSLCSWHALRRSSLNKSANMLAASRMLLAGCCFQKTFMEPAPHNMEFESRFRYFSISTWYLFYLFCLLALPLNFWRAALLAENSPTELGRHISRLVLWSQPFLIGFHTTPKRGHAAILCDWRFHNIKKCP